MNPKLENASTQIPKQKRVKAKAKSDELTANTKLAPCSYALSNFELLVLKTLLLIKEGRVFKTFCIFFINRYL